MGARPIAKSKCVGQVGTETAVFGSTETMEVRRTMAWTLDDPGGIRGKCPRSV